MSWLDAVIAVVALGATYIGYRHGLVGRAMSWVGLALGLILGVLFVDNVANALSSSTPSTRLVGSLAFLFLLTIVGQAVGIAVGALLRRSLPAGGILSTADRVGGAMAGLFSVLVTLWLLTPVLGRAAGWPARTARASVIVRAVDRYGPPPPESLETLARLVDSAPFPQVFDIHDDQGDVGPAPATGLSGQVFARVVRAVVKVEGRACDLIQQGSGWIVDADLVVTNAHVVAGETQTSIQTAEGRRLTATVVLFDPNRDLALLRAPGLGLEPLETAQAEVDQVGGVVGHPGGGPLQESPARIAERILAKGQDIYDANATVREVFVLAAVLEPGDSGAPLFDERGRVVGTAFAVDPGDVDTAYALTQGEVNDGISAAIEAGADTPVGTGPCLIG